MPPNDNRTDNCGDCAEEYTGSGQPLVHVPDTASGRLPLWKKVAYGIGGPPMQMTSNTVGFFISIFLLEVANISPFYNSFIVFSGRVWDAVTDPLVGYLVSRTETRLGKQRPWILFSTPVAAVGFFLLWYVPNISSMELKFLYFLGMYFIYQAAVTAYHVPYSSMTVVLTDNQSDRDVATAFRMGFEVFGVLLGNAIFGTIVTLSRAKISALSANSTNGTNMSTSLKEEQKSIERNAYMLGAGILCIIYIFCCVVVFAAIRERRGLIPEVREPFCHSLRSILKFKPYWTLMLAFLFISLGLQITQGNLALYATHSLKRGDHMGYAIMALLVSAIVFLPMLQILVTKFGKKTIFVSCQLFFVPILVIAIFLPEGVHPAALYALMVFAGVVVSNAFLLPWSMLPDVIDAYMLQTGCRREATFYSFYVFFNKFATGFSLGLSQIVLGISGYDEEQRIQSETVGKALRYLFGPGPLVCVCFSVFFIWLYPINEKERSRIRNDLDKLKQNLKTSDTKHDRLGSCISSSATLPSMVTSHSVDDFVNSRTNLTSRVSNGHLNGNSRV